MDNKFMLNIFIIIFAILLTACQSDPAIKAFANKSLSQTQYAKLEAPTGILILEIDGTEMDYAPQYHVLPGKRKLHVMVSAFKDEKAYKVGDLNISFYAMAEHTYLIKSLATTAQWNNEYNKKLNDFLWIEDATLDSVVAGKKP
jgi:hypothetical protein